MTFLLKLNTMLMKIHYKILKNSIYWSKVNVSNNKKMIPYNTKKKLNAIKFLGFYIVVFNRKYIAKITNPITKPQFLIIIKLRYTGIK